MHNYIGACLQQILLAIAPDGCPEHNKSVLLLKPTSKTGGSVIVKVALEPQFSIRNRNDICSRS
jgi:hypothetical protein